MFTKVAKRIVPSSIILYRAARRRSEVALTFDDGPVVGATNRVLDLLDRTGHRATFFVIGRRAEREPDLLRRIVAGGHEIGNHSYSHSLDFGKHSAAELASQIESADSVVDRAVGIRPRFFRPPFGCVSIRLANELRKTSRLPIVLWSTVVGGDDAINDDTADRVIAHACSAHFTPGEIILLHDPNVSTIDGLPAVLRRLEELSLVSVPLSKLLAIR
jgi:peptidoglycan/xylan/chitin deacetylase (PgdA/CDA1 family)